MLIKNPLHGGFMQRPDRLRIFEGAINPYYKLVVTL